jgi:hypothetical protein
VLSPPLPDEGPGGGGGVEWGGEQCRSNRGGTMQREHHRGIIFELRRGLPAGTRVAPPLRCAAEATAPRGGCGRGTSVPAAGSLAGVAREAPRVGAGGGGGGEGLGVPSTTHCGSRVEHPGRRGALRCQAACLAGRKTREMARKHGHTHRERRF